MILLDTHVLIWTLRDRPELGKRACAIIDRETADDEALWSAISVWEIALLVGKRRLDLGCPIRVWIEAALALPGLRLIPLLPEISMESVELPDFPHKDPSDRIIVATARFLDAPLLTGDEAILDYARLGHLSVIDARL